MKRLILILFIIILAAALVAGAVVVYTVLNFRPILENAIGRSLNTAVKIKDVSLDKKNSILRFKDMAIYNPPGFDRNEALADIPDLAASYDRRLPFKDKKIHLLKLKLYIKTLTVVKREDGKLNVEELNISDTDINLLPICADELVVNVDNLLYKEFRKGKPWHIEMFEIKIKDKSYQDLSSIDHIVMNIVLDSLKKTTIKGTMLYASASIIGVSSAGAGLFATAVLARNKPNTEEFQNSFNDVYAACRQVLSGIADSVKENKKSGVIKGKINNTSVVIKIKGLVQTKTQVSVDASMLMTPKPRVAKAILYEISDKLRK